MTEPDDDDDDDVEEIIDTSLYRAKTLPLRTLRHYIRHNCRNPTPGPALFEVDESTRQSLQYCVYPPGPRLPDAG